MKREDAPTIVAAGPSHTTNTQSFLRFLRCVATDKENKFNYAGMKDEIERNFDLRLDRRLLYMAIIPIVKMRIQEQADGFDWMDQYDFRPGMRRPDWGPGRDDPMNLTKFFLLDPDGSKRKKDQTTGNADFPAIWDLSVREEHSMNWAGETRDPLAVIIDSALGLGAPPGPSFVKQMKDIRAYLQRVKPPPYPLAPAASEERVKKGRALYKVHCADCHEAGGKYFGKVVAVEDVGTDRERFDTWRQEDADGANRVAKEMGVERKDMVKDRGYMAAPISGVWLTAPYLHNGSVPNLVELLKPPGERIKTFYRGCDLYDPRNMGFLSDGSEPTCLNQFLFDTQLPGNGNGGHTYGTALDSDEKVELIEYLKTL
jgi:mono/diheme cytochrome c family protein